MFLKHEWGLSVSSVRSKTADFGSMAKRNMNVKERRKYPRIRVRWPVSILAADGLRQGKMEDISLGGGFIRCEKPPRPNEKVLLNWEKSHCNCRVDQRFFSVQA